MPTREYPNPEPSGGCQAGATRLHTYLMETFGGTNLGCYNPNSTMSGGGPSWHVHGEAIDLGCNWYDLGSRAIGDNAFNYVVEHKEELNLQQAIWATHIYDVSYDHVSAYGGTDHHNHVHVALGHHAAATWAPGGGDDLDARQNQLLEDLHAFMVQSKNSDTNVPFVRELWQNMFQGKGGGMLTGEFRGNWKRLFEHLGLTKAADPEPDTAQVADPDDARDG